MLQQQGEDKARRDENRYSYIRSRKVDQKIVHWGAHYSVTVDYQANQGIADEVCNYQEAESGSDSNLGGL